MPRIRTIKPEFCQSEQVASVEPLARLLFIELWMFCDDGGNHAFSPRLIRAECFPFDDDIDSVTILRLVRDLYATGLIDVYESDDGSHYLHVTGWHHQRIDKPRTKHPTVSASLDSETVYELFEDPKRIKGHPGHRTVVDRSQNGHGTVCDSSVKGGEGKGGEGTCTGGEEDKSAAPAAAILALWNQAGLTVARRLTDTRRGHIRARWKDPWWREHWQEAVERASRSSFCRGKNARSWVATIDWFIRPDTAQKLIEGDYDDRAPKTGRASDQLAAAQAFADQVCGGDDDPAARDQVPAIDYGGNEHVGVDAE